MWPSMWPSMWPAVALLLCMCPLASTFYLTSPPAARLSPMPPHRDLFSTLIIPSSSSSSTILLSLPDPTLPNNYADVAIPPSVLTHRRITPLSSMFRFLLITTLSIRATLGLLTGFSFTKIRQLLYHLTGIPLAAAISCITKPLVQACPLSLRFLIQPILLLYYFPLILIRGLAKKTPLPVYELGTRTVNGVKMILGEELVRVTDDRGVERVVMPTGEEFERMVGLTEIRTTQTTTQVSTNGSDSHAFFTLTFILCSHTCALPPVAARCRPPPGAVAHAIRTAHSLLISRSHSTFSSSSPSSCPPSLLPINPERQLASHPLRSLQKVLRSLPRRVNTAVYDTYCRREYNKADE